MYDTIKQNKTLILDWPLRNGAWWIYLYYFLISLDEFGLGPPYHVDILRFYKLLFA